MAPSRIDDSEILGDCNSDSITVKDKELANLKARLSQHAVEIEQGIPRAWIGSELDEGQYLIVLTAEEKLEVELAARDYIASRRQISLLTPTSFPLPKLGPRIRLERERLSDGLGFIIMRGLKPSEYDSHMNIVLYAGISSYIGNKRAIQFPGGPVLCQSLDMTRETLCTHPDCMLSTCDRLVFRRGPGETSWEMDWYKQPELSTAISYRQWTYPMSVQHSLRPKWRTFTTCIGTEGPRDFISGAP